jgi:hypothetical protein
MALGLRLFRPLRGRLIGNAAWAGGSSFGAAVGFKTDVVLLVALCRAGGAWVASSGLVRDLLDAVEDAPSVEDE